MTPEQKLEKISVLIESWMAKQGHDRCWYYPEIFEEICETLNIIVHVKKRLPPEKEFEEGCRRYKLEQYKNF